MFSQHSWWDFAKFCLALAIPYYAYVLWTYYREDIREWLTNRGEKSEPVAALADEVEDEDDSSLYKVSIYAPEKKAVPASSVQNDQGTDYADEEPNSPAPPYANAQPEADLHDAPVIADEQPTGFGLPLVVNAYRPGEQSVETVLENAKELVVNEDGTVAAADPTKQEVNELAAVMNQQRGASILGDMKFNR